MYGSPQFEEMRAKCIGQELSWEVPAAKWEQVLLDVQAGRKPQVLLLLLLLLVQQHVIRSALFEVASGQAHAL